MKLVRSLRALRWCTPSTVLLVTGIACCAGLWQTGAHRRTLASLETSLLTCPHPEKLSHSLAQLLRLLQDDPRKMNYDDPRKMNYEARAVLAQENYLQFIARLDAAQRTFEEQRSRWQDLQAMSRRRQEVDRAAQAFMKTLKQRLGHMSDFADGLQDIGPRPAPGEPDETASIASDATRRARTILDFRAYVSECLELIEQLPDPAERLYEQYRDAQDRVQLSYVVTGALAALGMLAALLLNVHLRLSLWEPLAALRTSLEKVSNRDFGPPQFPEGAPELQGMQGALAVIRSRCSSAESEMARNVEDRSTQRVRSERLAGIGLLATGVAHEINNPLTAIVGAAEGLQWRLSDVATSLPPDDAEIVREYLAMIQSESKRCRLITTKLLDFARGRDGERSLYDLTAIVHEVVEMFRHVRQYQSRKIVINREDPCRAWCNGPEIKQVILNLVANALQATPDEGRLDISLNGTTDLVEIVFKDTGSGMTSETLEHLFDPFYSTKGPGQGTGLGLSISHAIVEKHQGTLEAGSAGPGHGSTFRLTLPASEDAAHAVTRRRAA